MKRTALVGIVALGLAGGVTAAPWPMYRGDAGRMNYTPEDLPDTPTRQWVYKPTHPPMPAWPNEPKMTFDRAHHAVADNARVCFGAGIWPLEQVYICALFRTGVSVVDPLNPRGVRIDRKHAAEETREPFSNLTGGAGVYRNGSTCLGS